MRNAAKAKHLFVDCFYSRHLWEVLGLLYLHGYVSTFYMVDNQKVRVFLKYDSAGYSLLVTLRIHSTSGRHYFVRSTDYSRYTHYIFGLVYTSQGLCTLQNAISQGIGGELILTLSY